MDKDILFLGAKKIVHDFAYNQDNCTLITQDDLQESICGGKYKHHMSELFAFLGSHQAYARCLTSRWHGIKTKVTFACVWRKQLAGHGAVNYKW